MKKNISSITLPKRNIMLRKNRERKTEKLLWISVSRWFFLLIVDTFENQLNAAKTGSSFVAWRFSHSYIRWYLSKFPLLVAGAHFCIDRRTVHFDLFVLIVLPALSFSSFCRFVHSGSSLRWYARIDFCSLCTFFRWTVRTRTLFEWFIYLVAFCL